MSSPATDRSSAVSPAVSRSRRILFTLIINLGVLLALAAAGELWLRHSAPELDAAIAQARVEAPGLRTDGADFAGVTGALQQVGRRAGAMIDGRNPDTLQTHAIAFNQYGLRDYGVLRPLRKSGELRVAVVGDSFVENLGLPWEQALTAGLERELAARGIAADVLGLSLSGTGTLGQLELLRRFLADLDPQLVLLAWFNNDLCDLRRELAGKPRRIGPLARSYLYLFLRLRLDKLIQPADQRREEYRLLYAPFFVNGEQDPLVKPLLQRTAELLAEMQRISADQGARFGVFSAPNALSFSEISLRPAYSEISALVGRPLSEFRPGLAYYTLHQLAAGQGIPSYPLLFSDFKEQLAGLPPQSMQARQKLYFAADPHWNEGGCSVAAKALAEWIVAEKLLGEKQPDATVVE